MTTATLTRKKQRKVVFAAGAKRFVCVNRNAILAATQHKRDYPTMIIVEEGKTHELHEVHQADVDGTLRFDETRNDLPAKVFVETDKEIVAYVNDTEPTYLKLPQRRTGCGG